MIINETEPSEEGATWCERFSGFVILFVRIERRKREVKKIGVRDSLMAHFGEVFKQCSAPFTLSELIGRIFWRVSRLQQLDCGDKTFLGYQEFEYSTRRFGESVASCLWKKSELNTKREYSIECIHWIEIIYVIQRTTRTNFGRSLIELAEFCRGGSKRG
ncbi:hypothetical protein RRG08_029784 [Elysia crispata]|uniref:Uncharacterized protein n=1 Tax=Elysia crispata TaxID=231223 RepID=A0AAE0YN20_9GAST|nr:hypothetical protein RRG08_029784 [Elysia crispata]